jgi:predicted Rdx family selenoprotein
MSCLPTGGALPLNDLRADVHRLPPCTAAAAPLPPAAPVAVKGKKTDDPALLDPTTFVAPHPAQQPGFRVLLTLSVSNSCRAAWTSTELMLTFPPPAVTSVALIPLNTEETGGRFRVWVFGEDELVKLVWDRKVRTRH